MIKKKYASVLVAAAVAGLALGASVPSSQAASKIASQTVRLYISADTNIQDLWVKSLIPAFKLAYPGYDVNVTFDLHGDHDAQATAKITAASVLHKDSGVDLIDGGFTQQLGLAGLLWHPTPGLVPNLRDVGKSVVAAGKGGIPYRASSVLLAYNSTNVKTPPKTLDELLAWIKANPGKFTYNAPNGGGSGYAFVQTVVDKYLSAKDLATLQQSVNKPLQSKWAQGLETLRSLNPYTYGKNGTYPANNAETLKDLGTGLVDMASVWSDQFASAVKAGTMPANIKITQIATPSFTGGASYLGIPSSSQNRNAARLLANWVLSPAAQNIIVSGILNGMPVIPVSKLDPAVAASLSDVDVSNLRSTYLSANANDLKSAWAAAVPGK
ncbi:MAG: extracellular solute-binding protein [Actinobacteria bacterium]|nr:extracellular solute-binding protein [Actinomycetota bacterium]